MILVKFSHCGLLQWVLYGWVSWESTGGWLVKQSNCFTHPAATYRDRVYQTCRSGLPLGIQKDQTLQWTYEKCYPLFQTKHWCVDKLTSGPTHTTQSSKPPSSTQPEASLLIRTVWTTGWTLTVVSYHPYRPWYCRKLQQHDLSPLWLVM